MNQRSLGLFQVVIASVLFGFLGVFGKLAFARGISIGELLTFRFFLASALLWAAFLLFAPRLIRLRRRQLLNSLALGILGYAVFSTLYFEAIAGVSVALAALLLYTYPFWIGILNHFTGEPMPPIRWLFLSAALLGLALLIWGTIEIRTWWAVLAGLGCAITYALYIALLSKHQQFVPALSSGLYVITGAAIGLQAFHSPDWGAWSRFDQQQFLIIVGMALLCTIAPLILIQAALQKLKSIEVSLLSMIEPITAAVAGWILFSEALSPRQLLGLLLILGALTLDNLKTRRDAVSPASGTP